MPARGALCRLSPQKSPLFTLALPTEAMPTVGGRVRSVGRPLLILTLGRILILLASDIQMGRLSGTYFNLFSIIQSDVAPLKMRY